LETLREEAKIVPVIHEADVCVLGGSCTGTFAAIRAARMGMRVALVERQNCLGGVATLSLVCAWHSLWDTAGQKQIIAGLTQEVMGRLDRCGALRLFERTNPSFGCTFNPEELKIELDEMVAEAGLKLYLHTAFAAPAVGKDGRIEAVFVENKSGRGAIRAKVFVDATGDGDLAARLGCETYFASHLQPATTCALISGWNTLELDESYTAVLRRLGPKHGLPEGFAWGCHVPGSDNYMLAGTRIYGTNPADADDLTKTEVEGRRQVRAILDILREASPNSRLSLAALPSRVGLRESRHIRCRYQLTGADVLSGRRFSDAVANGSYRVDIHHQDRSGITLRYLDGTEEYCRPGYPNERSRWRPETPEDPTFYQVPYRAMVPAGPYPNLLVAGRMIDADPVAHAAIRVMVNMNQTGEAAGVAATLAAQSGTPVGDLDPSAVRAALADGGSAVV
jgi:glycine/D-amino acid oxidase-like deaminating enzyme